MDRRRPAWQLARRSSSVVPGEGGGGDPKKGRRGEEGGLQYGGDGDARRKF